MEQARDEEEEHGGDGAPHGCGNGGWRGNGTLMT
jgi:hypothetical protein